jgi:hypothetical protein
MRHHFAGAPLTKGCLPREEGPLPRILLSLGWGAGDLDPAFSVVHRLNFATLKGRLPAGLHWRGTGLDGQLLLLTTCYLVAMCSSPGDSTLPVLQSPCR